MFKWYCRCPHLLVCVWMNLVFYRGGYICNLLPPRVRPVSGPLLQDMSALLEGTPKALTLRAVVSLPALQADAVALLVAGVVTQRVVPRSAVICAAVSEVVLVAEDVVRVAQLALLAEVHVLGPVPPRWPVSSWSPGGSRDCFGCLWGKEKCLQQLHLANKPVRNRLTILNTVQLRE